MTNLKTIVVFLHTMVKDENDPDITEVFKAFEALCVYIINEGHARLCIFDKARLAWRSELFTKTRLKDANRLHTILLLVPG